MMESLEELLRSFETYNFQSFKVNLITKYLLDDLINKEGKIRISLDLGKTFLEAYLIEGQLIVDAEVFDLLSIYKEIDYDSIYVVSNGKYGELAFFRDGLYYKLYPVGKYEAPTIEISGIKMHRVVGITPWRDAESKVNSLKIRNRDTVLDICTGLGYTAINSYRRGGQVISVEKDRNVLDLAKYNPWSQELEDIPIIIGDAYDVVKELPSNSFNVVIHDPPRFALAGHLYSEEFYHELYRILRRRGRLFHYVGEPGARKGKNIIGGVVKRLKKIGFKTMIKRNLKGVYAYKF